MNFIFYNLIMLEFQCFFFIFYKLKEVIYCTFVNRSWCRVGADVGFGCLCFMM